MDAKRTLALTLLATVLAGASLSAAAAGHSGMHSHNEEALFQPSTDMMPPEVRMEREAMQRDMRAYHDAVMSGALTDAELMQLKNDRAAAAAQIRQIRTDLRAKTMALINNSDRSAARSRWPDELAGHERMPPVAQPANPVRNFAGS